MTEWWTPQTSNLIGAIAGASVGMLGGLAGALIGVCAPRGRCRGLVVGLMSLLAIAGAAVFSTGVYAILATQPFHVVHPLLLVGGIAAAVSGCLLLVTLTAYRVAAVRMATTGAAGRTAADFGAASTVPIMREVVALWGPGGRYVRPGVAGACMAGIAALGGAVAYLMAPTESRTAWMEMTALAGGAAGLMALMTYLMHYQAKRLTVQLDSNRLAAEEFRRG